MTKEEYSINIEKLISWAKAYYVDDEPIASDEEYDKLARECLEFENKNPNLINPNSPNRRVGGAIEIVEEDKEGFLISSYDVDKVAKKIAELSNDETTCINLSKNTKEKALIFSEDLFLGKIQKVVNA